MGLILKPQVEVENIEIPFDAGEDDMNPTTRAWGPTFPIIKINDYILGSGELLDFTMTVRLNSLPSFSFEIDDSNYAVRETLKKSEIDKCVIFVGYKDWYIKFNGLITSTNSDSGDPSLTCNGILYNEDWYKTEQLLYKEMTYEDILKDICTKAKIGLYTDDNPFLSKQPELLINPNMVYLDLLPHILRKYTQCFWMIDFFYYLHVCNIEQLRKNPYDKFSLNQLGESISERDIVITTDPYYDVNEKDTIKDPKKLVADYYSINTNFGKTFIDNYDQYFINGTEIPSTQIGEPTSKKYENMFSVFESHFQPFYKDIINKSIGGNSIKLTMKNILFELTPFSIINLEIYLPKNSNREGEDKIRLEEEHSGKKVVIGYSYNWQTKDEESDFPTLTQEIEVI